ncbi:hypothetical protein MMC26_002040 [Xylographa opegraphella]|nr:hypothetical protein [Xylographa opegraphella]
MSGAQYIEHGNGRPWHKRVLIPFWVLQIIFMAIQVASASLGIYWNTAVSAISSTTVYTDNNSNTTTYTTGSVDSSGYVSTNGGTYTYTYNNTAVIALYAIILTIALLGLLFSLAEIILFARHHLTPTKYFVSNLLKFLAWTALFVVGIANAALYGTYVLSLVVNVVVELLFLGTLIYASVIFHRFRKERRMGGGAAMGSGQGVGMGKQQPVGVTYA